MTAAAQPNRNFGKAMNRRIAPQTETWFRQHLARDLDVRQHAYARQYPHGPMLGVMTNIDGKPTSLDRFRIFIDHHLWHSLQAQCLDFHVQLEYPDDAPIEDPPTGIEMRRLDEYRTIPLAWGRNRVIVDGVSVSFHCQSAGEDLTAVVLDKVADFFEGRA